MNKKLVVLAALIFGAAGLILGQTVKAQEAMKDSPATTEVTNDEAMNAENAENAMAPEAPAAPAEAPAAKY